jgi:hypothetical protein
MNRDRKIGLSRREAKLDIQVILLRSPFYIIFAVSSLWISQCILGNLTEQATGVEIFIGFPRHVVLWNDGGGGRRPFHTPPNDSIMSENAYLCVGSSLVLLSALFFASRRSFRMKSAIQANRFR